MTLSGNLTTWQRAAVWLQSAAFSVFTGGLLHWFMLTVVRTSTNIDPTLRAVALAFGPTVAALGFALTYWINRDTVVEFTCDDTALRFRKLGASRSETRDLSEIVNISELARNGVVSGYSVRFRDGVEALLRTGAAPDGPAIGDWLRAHRDGGGNQEFRISSPRSAQGWQPPAELMPPGPRPVRLTGAGIALGLITVFIIVAAGDGLLGLAGYSRRRTAEVRRLFAEGRETQGVVRRLFETHGRGPHYHVTYRYSAGGVTYDAPFADIRKEHWQSLRVGSPIAVRYSPSDPASSILSADPPYIVPLWFPIILFPVCCGFSSLAFLALLRARRYLAYGVAAPAQIVSVSGRPGAGSVVNYEFALPSGAKAYGSCTASDPPPEGSVVCVLYDPKHPDRNTKYPLVPAKLTAA